MNIENLLKLYDKYRGEYSCLYKKEFEKVIEEILILHNLDLSELKAKVYTYEKIIANSNFAPILKESNNKKKNLGVDKE